MKFILIIIFFQCHISLASEFCQAQQSAKPNSNEFIDQQLKYYSNQKIFSEEADETLTKLIKAKSDLLSRWMAKEENQNITESTLVKNWRLYYFKNIILTQYPLKNKKMNLQIESLSRNLQKKLLPPSQKSKLEKIFLKSQAAAIKTIQNYKLKSEKEIIDKIKTLQLYWPDLKTAQAADQITPLDIIDWGIAYNPITHKINMGLQSIDYPNDETYLAVFAHEIGHVFDSCRWGAYFTGVWPFEKIGECLRSTQSVKALKRDDSQLDIYTKQGKISTDLALSLKQNPTCNKLVYPQNGLQADQLPESFADWFATETMANIAKLNAKKLRIDLCINKKLSEGSSYSSNHDRLFKIYQAHPKFTLDKKSDSYCSY